MTKRQSILTCVCRFSLGLRKADAVDMSVVMPDIDATTIMGTEWSKASAVVMAPRNMRVRLRMLWTRSQ